MPQEEIRIAPSMLREFVKRIFLKLGMPAEDAQIEADVLIWANLRGVDSHGVLRVPGYVEAVREGRMNTRPDTKILAETPACLLIDADHGFGPVITVMVMSRTIEKAKRQGVSWSLIRNTTHQGAMGYYALMAARQGLAGLALCGTGPGMAPFGSRARGLHNNPISIAVPAGERRPVILDMATSVAAWGKISLAQDKGTSIPEGWALDQDGNPTTNPNEAAMVLPFGGPKGSAMAFMFECLSGIMVGNPMVGPVLLDKEPPPRGTFNGAVVAIDISKFTDLEAYKARVDDLIRGIKALPRAEGFDEILVPGEPEDRERKERERDGIPLPSGTVDRLGEVAEDLGIDMLAPL